MPTAAAEIQNGTLKTRLVFRNLYKFNWLSNETIVRLISVQHMTEGTRFDKLF